MKRYITILALFLCVAAGASEPARRVYNLNNDWLFYFASAYDSDAAEHITLPHTWNSDAATGTRSYLRTSANYLRTMFIPQDIYGKRLFLRIGAAQSVATLFVNGRFVGEHHGGYTSCTFEITDKVLYGMDNHIHVVVSNSSRNDVLPTSTDQNIYGGIYRDVELIVTNKSAISPLLCSTDGVFVEQQSITKERAKGVVRVCLSATDINQLTLDMRIRDDGGNEVYNRTMQALQIDDMGCVKIPYEINSPKLWSPAVPLMYSVEVSLKKGSELCDRVTVETGFRSITIDNDNRLCINGESVEVRGVNLPHDRLGRGVVVNNEDIEQDLDIIADMGANAVRSLSGPHNNYMYDCCDRRGLLVWVDIPFTCASQALSDICYYPTNDFRSNGMEQLREIVMQNYNHPSVVMWGLFSLVWQSGEDVVGYITSLNDLAHAIDSSRLTVGCSNRDGDINFITDLIVFNQNAGWERGRFEDAYVWCQQLAKPKWRVLRFGVCYGEDGSMFHQKDDIEHATRGTRSLPERRQTYMHECYFDAVESSGLFWGIWLNSMFDYASSRRIYGINQSGLVDFEHSAKKDAYYLYRAAWNNKNNTLYIAERRWRNRRDSLQQIKVYASSGTPTLFVNDDTVALQRKGRAVWVSDTVAIHGRARVRVVDSLGTRTDRIEFTTGNLLISH